MRRRTLFALGFAVLGAACSADPSGSELTTDGGAIPSVDAGGNPNPVTPDGGGGADGGGNVDSGGPKDTTAPLAVSDLAAFTESHTAITVKWTAPSDPPGGNVSSYEVRRSKANIANDAEFAAATAVTVPGPKAAGAPESFTVLGLDPDTTYYFAIRAKDAAGNVGPISNVASATTKARATVLLSEVAMANASGTDFIELVVTKAGNLKDVAVRQSQSPNVLHTFADFDVALGDRIVVHLTALPGPTGFAQEDAMKSKTASTETAAFASNDAWDVYAAENGLVATDNLLGVVDGTVTLDAVAYSNRDGDASTASMTAFAAARTAASWSFTAPPADGANDCATQREAVAVSTNIGDSNGACGRFTTGIGDGKSINRLGTTDTNSAT